jgi:hypothetical protein
MARTSLSVLPSLKIVASSEPLSPDEVLLLEAYAEKAVGAE